MQTVSSILSFEDFLHQVHLEGYSSAVEVLPPPQNEDAPAPVPTNLRHIYETAMKRVEDCLSDALKIALLEADTAGEIVITNPPAANQVRIFPRPEKQ